MPPDDKSKKRVEKLFSDLDQIARLQAATSSENQLTGTGSASSVRNEAPVLPSTNNGSPEMEVLLLRIRE